MTALDQTTRVRRQLNSAGAKTTTPLRIRRLRRTWLLLTPALLVMLAASGVAVASILTFSFWISLPYGMAPGFSIENYIYFFTNESYLSTILTTLQVGAILIPIMLLMCVPVAYFIRFQIQSERLKLFLLLLCIIPFWTSALIRMVAWLPLLGRNGLINQALISLGLIEEPAEVLLYSQPAMIMSMAVIWSVFMLGPIYFSMSNIQPMVVESARDLGGSLWVVFVRIVLPMSMPGVITGVLFVFVVMMGEFAIQRFIGGGTSMMLANVLMQNQGALQWPLASVVAVVITVITLAIVYLLFRLVDLRREL